MEKKIVVVGDKNKVLLFKAVGCYALSPKEEKFRAIFQNLSKKYDIIYIFSSYARLVEDLIKESQNSVYPIITILPEDTEDSFAMDKLGEQIKNALGSSAMLGGE